MKTLITILWVMPALVLCAAPLLATDVPADMSTAVTLTVGGQKISAQLPEDVQMVIRNPPTDPTYVQGTKGNESMGFGGSDDFDLYSIQVFDAPLLTSHGHDASIADLDQFIATEMAYYGKKFTIADKANLMPESLKAEDSKMDRYMLFEGTYSKTKNSKPKLFFWRVILVNGQFVMAQREIGGGFKTKNDIHPETEQEWEFLRSMSIVQ